jgi:hypothetical protein
MPMRSERGEGRLSSLFGLAVFAAAVLAVWNVAPVYIDDFALKDKMNEIARAPRGTNTDEKVMELLMRYVREQRRWWTFPICGRARRGRRWS